MAQHYARSHLLTPRTISANIPVPDLLANPPPILRLPLELLLQVYEGLQIDAQALLTLTCKTLLHRLGSKSWEHPVLTGLWHGDAYSSRWDAPRHIPASLLTPETLIRVPFLQALARDASHLTYCSWCKVLHPDLPSPSRLRLNKNAPCCLVAKGVVDWFAKDGSQSYTLLCDHIAKIMTAHVAWINQSDAVVEEPIHEILAAKHIFHHKGRRTAVTHTIDYSARSIERNLILKHAHTFSGSKLTPSQVLATDLRICPHLITTQSNAFTKEHGRLPLRLFKIRRKARLHSPLLPFAINNAFPVSRQVAWKSVEHAYRPTFVREDSQMFMSRSPDDDWWCRSCATKFRVFHAANQASLESKGSEVLTIEVWHNFGSYNTKAMENFNYLIKASKNSEMKSLSRAFLDFKTDRDMETKRADVSQKMLASRLPEASEARQELRQTLQTSAK